MAYYAKTAATKRRRLNRSYGGRTHSVFRRSARLPVRAKKTWAKPYKRRYYRKRVAARRPTPAAIISPYKSQKEQITSDLWSQATGVGPFQRGLWPTTDGHWALAFMLSPQEMGSSGDRKVEGDKARLLSANIQYIFSNQVNQDMTVRMTVLELKTVMEPLGGTTVNFTNNTEFLKRLFKDEEGNSTTQDFKTFLDASGRQRDYYAINTAEFKVLKQSIIKLGAHGSSELDKTDRPSVQGAHMYVKMNRLIDEGHTLTAVENNNRTTYAGASTNNYTRYAYYKPIVVLVEAIAEVGREVTAESQMVVFERNVKYTWRDAA